MKQVLFSGLLAVALVLSACERQSSVNSPVASGNGTSLMKTADQLDLTLSQWGQVDMMYYMGEDLSVLLNPLQMSVLNTLSVKAGDVSLYADPGDRMPRGALDMEALRVYRLILQANPDLPEDMKQQIQDAIDASVKRRMEIINDASLDDAAKKDALQKEHNNLMAQIFGENGDGNGGILRPEFVDKYKQLVADLEKKREEQRLAMIQARIDRQVQMWTKLLTLDEAQQSKMKELLLQQQTEADQLRQDLKGQPDALRAALKELQDRYNGLLRDVLLPDQQAIWDKMHQPRTGGGTGGGKTGGIDREIEYWTKVLGLTDQQALDLKAAMDKQHQATMDAMKADQGDPTKLREDLKAINDAFDAAVKGILTAEQYDKWTKMHPTIGGRRP
jgi:hypothetical protein